MYKWGGCFGVFCFFFGRNTWYLPEPSTQLGGYWHHCLSPTHFLRFFLQSFVILQLFVFLFLGCCDHSGLPLYHCCLLMMIHHNYIRLSPVCESGSGSPTRSWPGCSELPCSSFCHLVCGTCSPYLVQMFQMNQLFLLTGYLVLCMLCLPGPCTLL